jgi:beta-galactosidase/beta-glucuronidase
MEAAMTWKPVPGHIMTRWAQDVTPDNAWPEYPRPQMVRGEWLNLNGLWDYAVTPGDPPSMPKQADGQILVPFAIESALSGVGRALRPDECLWYRRSFTLPKNWKDRRILLHFGAVDWQAEMSVNGVAAGVHRGGYLPFSFEITPAVRAGENELVVRVYDPTNTTGNQCGKQVLAPKAIWYTAVSGIWQTVWIEAVPQTYIDTIRVTPDLGSDSVKVAYRLDGPGSGRGGVRIRVKEAGRQVANAETDAAEAEIRLPIPDVKRWTPETPFIYDLTVESADDRVESYFGMRSFAVGRDARGIPRLLLNGEPLFQYGPLDQGYWPDGLYTPPTDAAMRADIEMVKNLGCNMLRKHVKVEPARYYAYCDQIGLIVWQDMPNGGRFQTELEGAVSVFLNPSKRDDTGMQRFGRGERTAREAFKRELREMVDALYHCTCIGMWVPFNEGWGQFESRLIAEWLKAYDPTRPVDHASGWYDQGGPDCSSWHVYFKKLPLTIDPDRPTVLSEFGGYSLKPADHAWDPQVEFGYKKFATREALTEAYIALLENELRPWIAKGLSAAVYTQTTDVEIEVNGFVSYDRAVEKMEFAKVREAHRRLILG